MKMIKKKNFKPYKNRGLDRIVILNIKFSLVRYNFKSVEKNEKFLKVKTFSTKVEKSKKNFIV